MTPQGEAMMIQLLTQQAAAMKLLQESLAPQGRIYTEVIYGGETAGAKKTYNIGGKLTDIDNNLTQGKVFVFFDFHGDTNARPNFVLDAAVPGPRHFAPRQVGTITLVVATGSLPAQGNINLLHY